MSTTPEANQPLVVVVSGGGPVGLTFSLHLTMMMGKHVKIFIHEGRWFVDDQGKIRWQSEEQGKTRRDQVVTLQDHVIQQMPEYIQKVDTLSFQNINERVWPTSRNIPIREVEDRLLDLIQPFVQNGQIELIPENLYEQSECLIKGNFDILVGTDGSNSFVRRYCNIQMVSEGVEYACGVAYNIPSKVAPADEPFHQTLNCILTVSQTRYLVNSSTSRRGYLNIRLIQSEYDALREDLQELQLRNEPIDLLDYNKCPQSPVWTIIRQGLDFFKISSKYVFRVVPIEINVRHASIVVRELRFEVKKTEEETKDPDEKKYRTALAFLAGDAAINVHFWPGRGMNSGMKGAMALARNILRSCISNNSIHRHTPLRFLDFLDYEGFMARLRAREQQGRSLRILINPIDQYIEASYSLKYTNPCYVTYTQKLFHKLKETRERLEGHPQWPHKSRQITNEELQSAVKRISPLAVAQLTLANPWPTREMGGVEVLVEDAFPYDLKNVLPVPATSHITLEYHPPVIMRHRSVVLWIIDNKKMEIVEKLVQDIQNLENFAKSSGNTDGVPQLTVVRTIEEIKEWIKANNESIRKPDVSFKVVTPWIIKDDQTAVDVIRAVRSEFPRVPVLVFDNKHEETQLALEFPNVMTTDTEFELKEFVGVKQETQWNAGYQISHIEHIELRKAGKSQTQNAGSDTEHMRRIQSSRTHESIRSLASIMPNTIDQSLANQDDVTDPMQSLLITQRKTSNNGIRMIDSKNRNINPVTETVSNRSSRSNRKNCLNVLSMAQKCLLLFIFLLILIIGLGVLTSVIIFRCHQLTKELKMKDKTIFEEQAKSNQTIQQLNKQLEQPLIEQIKNNQTMQRLAKQLEQSDNELKKQNETIQRLNILRSMDNQKIQELTNQLQESLARTTPLNKNNAPVVQNHETDSNKINYYESTTKSGQNSIFDLNGNSCGCPSTSTCHNNCISKFGGIVGRCSGFLSLTCECKIQGVWQSKVRQC